jgi:CPA2 family monovalent cation:H+ antiporter-2
LLPALVGNPQASWSHVPLALGLGIFKVTILVASIFFIGGRLIPWLLERVAATHSRELFTLTVLVVALGIAVGSATLFGVSMALGAFLAGMVVGRSDFSLRAASEALPMRDAFAVLFFVAVGMLLHPRYLLEAPGLVAATLGVIMLGKPLAALAIVLLLRYPLKVALAVAVALAQIGEFSFILAILGKELGLLTDAVMHTVVATAIISITFNPLLYRLIDPVASWVAHRPRLGRWLTAHAQLPREAARIPDRTSTASAGHRAVVIGYGPVGQTVTRLLQENNIAPTIIELNRDTVRCLRESGVSAIYGDASQREILQGAGTGSAGSLVLSAAGMQASTEVIRLARELNPAIRILARAAYVRESPALHQAGAEYVFSGEGEVALAMTEAILRALGATPEQIDRERARVHRDLLGGSPVAACQDAPHRSLKACQSGEHL